MWFVACVVCTSVCGMVCEICVWGVCVVRCVCMIWCVVYLCGMVGIIYFCVICVVWCVYVVYIIYMVCVYVWYGVCGMWYVQCVYVEWCVVRGVYDACGWQETEAEAEGLTGFSAAALGADSDLRAAHGGPSTLKQWLHCPHSRAGTLGPSKAGHLHSAASAQGPTFRPSGPARTQ